MGFGDNDHTIRELMKFIEMTSREFIFEDATRSEGAPNYNVDGFKLKGGLIFLYFEFEYRKSRTINGDTILKLTCATKC